MSAYTVVYIQSLRTCAVMMAFVSVTPARARPAAAARDRHGGGGGGGGALKKPAPVSNSGRSDNLDTCTRHNDIT